MAQLIQRAVGTTSRQLMKPHIATALNLNFTRGEGLALKEPNTYEIIRYKGQHDGHNPKLNTKRMSPYKEEELLDEIHAVKNMEIHEPSPFHVVRRIRPIGPLQWNFKVVLRRLNLHSLKNGECMIIPNTPQYNDLLMKVKSVITVKPAIFENGKVPTEEDIGALNVCPYTGVVKVDEKLRLNQRRVAIDKSYFMRGSHFRFMIGHCARGHLNPKGRVS